MKLGRIIGKVWATKKDIKLSGIKLYIMQPVDEHDQPQGRPFIAADTVGSSEGDLVFWVSGAEACLPFKEKIIPSDVTIVGFVDRMDL